MAYNYFDFRDVKKQDCYGLLSSLVSQLSAESDSCYNLQHPLPVIFGQYERHATARYSHAQRLYEGHAESARVGPNLYHRRRLMNAPISRGRRGHFPLAQYAARHWADHAQFRNVSSHIKEVMKRLFDPAKPHFAAWVWLYDIGRYWAERMPTMHPTLPEAVPLYYASLCGFVGLAEHLIATHSRDVNSKGGCHTTPLHAASVKGHLEVTSLLLRKWC